MAKESSPGLVSRKVGRPPKKDIDPSLQKLLRIIGANLLQLRKDKGISQVVVATSARISLTTLNEIESRRFRDIRLSTLCSIARALSVSTLQLMTESDLKLKSSDQSRLLRASEEILNITRKISDHD